MSGTRVALGLVHRQRRMARRQRSIGKLTNKLSELRLRLHGVVKRMMRNSAIQQAGVDKDQNDEQRPKQCTRTSSDARHATMRSFFLLIPGI